MVDKPTVLAVIPARGGSKGIPRKNIRDFAGAPLIAYSIAAARQSALVDRVIVSTDDEEIAEVAQQWGAETPFLRPAEFAADNSTDFPVFEHALQWLADHEDYHPDIVIQLRPTSPVRPVACVDDAINILLAHPEADSVRGVVPSGQNPYKMWRVASSELPMQPLLNDAEIDEPYNAPRQSLPPTYWQTGHIDAIRSSTILTKKSMSGESIYPLLIDPRFTIDIDNPGDWAKSEWLVRHGGLEMVSPRPNRSLPARVELVVFDFDGVMTDNRVWVDKNGHEMVAAYRSDSQGLIALREQGVKLLVLSTETDTVVAARCNKIKLPYLQGINQKDVALRQYLDENDIDPAKTVFLGNDINDLSCFPIVGCAVVVSDAQPAAMEQADLVLSRQGGHGAVRELCEMILERIKSGAR